MLTLVLPLAVSRKRLGLYRFIKRLQQQTRWQIYTRVLPVVFLAVMLVGAFGWFVFTRYAMDKLIEHDRQEAAFLMDNLRQTALVKTMELEARKADILLAAVDAIQPTAGTAGRDWATGLLKQEHLAGVALISKQSGVAGDQADGLMHSLCLVDSLSGPVNDSRLLTWLKSHRDYFGADFEPSRWSGANKPGAAVLADNNPWHPTYIFPPILIEEVRGGSQVSAVSELAALLPVLVREEGGLTEGICHTVYFLSLNRMLEDLLGVAGLVSEPVDWWCVVNHQGRVIAAANGMPTVGSLLRNEHSAVGHGPFAVVSGADLVGDWSLGKPWDEPLLGGWLNQWVVTAGQSAGVPLAILIGNKAQELEATITGYISAVIGIALLAVLGAVFSVTRAVGRVSSRLTTLSQNMEQVAKGDYSRRIPTSEKDEVGRLAGYFNLMAVSLDETQRQLTDKTRHLESALENRQLLDQAKDNFLVLISHEVRTPLTSILGGVTILKSMVARADGPDREVLDKLNLVEVVEIIESSGDRLHGFMDDAIQMTSIQSSNKELELTPTSVGSLVELGLCGVREMARARNVDVVNGLDQAQGWQVLCDEKVMTLAFEKILKNAVVHNFDKGRIVIREVEEVPGEGQFAGQFYAGDVDRLNCQPSFAKFKDLPLTWRIIEIFNTGEAIPAESCEALFGKFELVGRIEHHQRGSGLSLPIAQSALESHGGRIGVHSVKLQGNSFYLLLPTILIADLETRRLLPAHSGGTSLGTVSAAEPAI